jgi:hypothetical protein
LGSFYRPLSDYCINLTDLQLDPDAFEEDLRITDLINCLRSSAVLPKLTALSFRGDVVRARYPRFSPWKWSPSTGVQFRATDDDEDDDEDDGEAPEYPYLFEGFRTDVSL